MMNIGGYQYFDCPNCGQTTPHEGQYDPITQKSQFTCTGCDGLFRRVTINNRDYLEPMPIQAECSCELCDHRRI